jgi:hypothetical protein
VARGPNSSKEREQEQDEEITDKSSVDHLGKKQF